MSSAPFTHTPRPAIAEARYADQRYFGTDHTTAVLGIKNGAPADFTAAVTVLRFERSKYAHVEINTGYIEGARFSANVSLPPDALRELARCLIDAAADIEAEQEGGAA